MFRRIVWLCGSLVLLTGMALAGCARMRWDFPKRTHEVRPGEKLEAIARAHRIEPLALRQANQIPLGYQPVVGSVLLVPAHNAYLAPKKGARPALKETPAPPQASQTMGALTLIWPLKGPVTRPFEGQTFGAHRGLDISGASGAAIVAAAPGKVIYSGDGVPSYGNLVILEHPGGYTTHYAHNSRNLVRQGDRVTQGQAVALAGQTGRATGPHLHFEIRKNSEAVNPLLFLPQ